MALQRYQWQTVAVDEPAAARLAGLLDLPLPLARLLVSRGYVAEDAVTTFLNPRLSGLSDPFEIAGMTPAVDRILHAIASHERICVFGDYDVDGVTSSALLLSVLKRLGADVVSFLPHREQEGYGVSAGALKRCLEDCAPSLIVTVDCGTNAVESIGIAASHGVDVVVTDHHEPSKVVAEALAVVNPKLGAPSAARLLAGVGVTFKLCHALVKRLLSQDGLPDDTLDLRDYLPLVALGTVCDMVPLVEENRTLARAGLERLNRARGIAGIEALRTVAGVEGDVTAYHLGFMLGPRLNAAGRLDAAMPALDLLMTKDAEHARSLATLLDGTNRQRQHIERRMVKQALEDVESGFDASETFGIVLGRSGWDVGVVGIAASRIVRKYNRPTIIVSFGDGEGRGSCRSVEGLDLMEVLEECRDTLSGFGGHKMAAGIRVEKQAFGAFQERFNAACAQRLRGRDLTPVQRVDAWLTDLGEADTHLLDFIERLGPLGTGNPRPVWGVRGVVPVGQPRRVGRNEDHLKILVASGGHQVDAIGFGMGHLEIGEKPLDLLFEVERNHFRGRVNTQLRLLDMRLAGGA
ncbi:MAG: single-stranded-DNA-specific exonuclease RecJ [Kiritimatiellae bacterium]|nr:single-stranded-DNA-specific exonuclease RecJ [Kiritimatiellia bacterium]